MANTPNLDLVKPAGTDKALVSVINSNSDKIDTGFGSLSDQIGAYNLGELSSLAALESALDTYCSNLPANSRRTTYFRMTSNPAPFGSTYYIADVTKIAANRYQVEARRTNSAEIVYGYRTNDGWTWDLIAKESQVNKCASIDTTTISANGSLSLNASSTPPLPSAYLLILNGNGGNYPKIYAGVGYGAEATRHKIVKLAGNQTDPVTIEVDESKFGLNLTNTSGATQTVKIVNLYK